MHHNTLRCRVWDSSRACCWAYSPVGQNTLAVVPPTEPSAPPPPGSEPGYIYFVWRQYVPVGLFWCTCVSYGSFDCWGSLGLVDSWFAGVVSLYCWCLSGWMRGAHDLQSWLWLSGCS